MSAVISEMTPNQESTITMMPVGRGVADAAAHRLPAGMADVNRIDVRIAHQAAERLTTPSAVSTRVVGYSSPAAEALTTLSMASTRS